MKSAPAVIHVVISLAPGGLERLVVDWTNERNLRHPGSTTICCLDESGELAEEVTGNAVFCVNAIRSRFPWDMSAVGRMKSRCSVFSVQCSGEWEGGQRGTSSCILHAHNLAAWQYAVLARIGTRAKLVYTQHGRNVHNCGLRDKVRGRALAHIGCTDRITAVSNSTAEDMTACFGVHRSRITVVENGIAVKAESGSREGEGADIRRKMGIASDACVIGSVGRLAHVKGYDRLIRTFVRLCGHAVGSGTPSQKTADGDLSGFRFQVSGSSSTPTPPLVHPSFSEGGHSHTPTCPPEPWRRRILLLVGDGPERAPLERLATELGVADRVVFAGFQRNAQKFLHAMDLFVLPSRSEGMPVALLEAMAARVPVAATFVGECAEVLENGACGTILPDEESSWPDVIRQAIARGGATIDRASRVVRDRYSSDMTLNKYESLYASLFPG